MGKITRILAVSAGTWVVAFLTGTDAQTAHAQVQTSTTPSVRLPRQSVLSRFAPRGGIGTTPFLGNINGLGAYSVNYDKVAPEVRSSYRGYNRRLFRRTR